MKKCGGALCDGAYRIFCWGGVMQKVKWAKMVENGQFLQYFLHRFEQV
ncbi:hypothetical protein HPS_1064 [Glaesserella parasuis 29755]|nr:hypothetical protein HPS_1064 [Glaesserella parasuis 29755]